MMSESVVESSEPIPPRYRWLKFFAKLSAVVFLLLIALRLAWGWEADRRLNAEIARWRAAGEPVYLHELQAQFDAISPEDDRVAFLDKAAEALLAQGGAPTSAAGVPYYMFEDELAADWLDDVATLFVGREAVIANTAAMRTKPRSKWRVITYAPGNAPWGNYRALSRFTALWVQYAYLRGDHGRSVEALTDVQVIADAVATHPSWISQLVAFAISELGHSALEEMGGQLRIDPLRAGVDDGCMDATPIQVKALQTLLLSDTGFTRAWRSATIGERAAHLKHLEWLDSIEMPLHESAHYWLLKRPLIVLDTLHLCRGQELFAGAIGAPAEARPKDDPKQAELVCSVVYFLSHPLLADGFRSSTTDVFVTGALRALARRQLAGIALAIRLFEADHGRLPPSLEALVPDYFPAIPVDPFSPRQRPLLYRNSGNPTCLYSVGQNGLDDGGVTLKRPNGAIDWNSGDILFCLNGYRLDGDAMPASSQAADNDGWEDDDQRHENDRDSEQHDP